MSSDEVEESARQGKDAVFLTDPKEMRALAHPVRMALIEMLAVGDLTATQASEVLGESPANCAFHLRTLAKYGFVEEAGGGKGRERPWRLKHRTISVETHRLQDPQAKLAAEALDDFWHERLLARIGTAYAKRSWPAGWENSAHSSDALVYLTPEEAGRLAREAFALVERYADRRTDPGLRPPGARPVEYASFVFPATGLPAEHGTTRDETASQQTRDIS